MAAFGGCADAVNALGCDFVFSGTPISESCPVTCDECIEECVDNDDAMSAFGGCSTAVAALGCDFVFSGWAQLGAVWAQLGAAGRSRKKVEEVAKKYLCSRAYR